MNRYDFERARKLYPGKKRDLEQEWANFEKKYRRSLDKICPLLTPAIEAQIAYRATTKDWCPPWKHFATWINGGWWTEEIPQTKKPKPVRCFHCGAEDIAVSGFGKPPRCWRDACKAEYEKL